jgi:hypothetical protein
MQWNYYSYAIIEFLDIVHRAVILFKSNVSAKAYSDGPNK